MTDHFEVRERDGAARLGELRLADPVTTPALADDVLVDAGSLWPAERAVPDPDGGDGAGRSTGGDGDGGGPGDRGGSGDRDDAWPGDGDDRDGAERAAGTEAALTVLPHRSFPSGTPDEVADAFAVEHPDVDYPSAAVVSPSTAADRGADAYVLAGAPGYVGHAAAFVEAIVETREAVPADAALYLAGVATPRNVATLVYAGVDLVDADRAVLRGTQGRYLTTEGEYDLADLDELPCSCPACRGPREDFDREDCAAHNRDALAAELSRVRRRIRDGRLRDYVEGQARHDQWLTATMRRLDQQYAYLEERTPVRRQAEITAATEDTLRRVEIQRFAERVTERYRSRFQDRPLVLVPCSARKPYSQSQSHAQFHDAIGFRGHVCSMTSPIGVVPQELELTYPAQHYDAVVTGRWTANEVEFVADVFEAFLADADYPAVLAHVTGDGYRRICERVEAAVDVPFTYTATDHPTTDESLAALDDALDGYDAYRKRERQHNTLRAVADYQFGAGAGDELFPELTAEGRYPQLRAHDADGVQLAQLAREYGLLATTIEGGRRWVESDVPTATVEIDPFVPHGSVLAPGVVDADDGIRVGDEVVIEGDAAFGVGRAQMSGPEMSESTRGVAVRVRHVEER